jgi:hypothetical protein
MTVTEKSQPQKLIQIKNKDLNFLHKKLKNSITLSNVIRNKYLEIKVDQIPLIKINLSCLWQRKRNKK